MKDRDLALNQRLIDKQRVKQRYNTKMQVETDKMNRELEIKLRQQREHLQVILIYVYSINLFSTFAHIIRIIETNSMFNRLFYLESNEGEGGQVTIGKANFSRRQRH